MFERLDYGSGQITKSINKQDGSIKATEPTVAGIGPSKVAHFAQQYS